VNENVAVRFNAMYENSDTFRDYGHPERYGFNPTVTLKPDDDTKIKLSYEFYHDFRLVDRGNPSQGLPGGATRFNPTAPFAPRCVRPAPARRRGHASNGGGRPSLDRYRNDRQCISLVAILSRFCSMSL
jgi:outer membrane receptor protein involved in Fe transport